MRSRRNMGEDVAQFLRKTPGFYADGLQMIGAVQFVSAARRIAPEGSCLACRGRDEKNQESKSDRTGSLHWRYSEASAQRSTIPGEMVFQK
jgi:hypothetical protein